MDLLPTYLQALCIILDCYLIAKFPNGMVRNYLWFSLGRSLIRVYAQWFMAPHSWTLIYWWGEGLGYIVTILLIYHVISPVLIYHRNTALFYTLTSLGLVCLVLWNLHYPLTFRELLVTGNAARVSVAFLLLIALVLGNGWDSLSKWLSFGIIVNVGCQMVGGWYELRLGPTVETALVHQLGFLVLQMAWLVGVTRPTPQLTAAQLAGLL